MATSTRAAQLKPRKKPVQKRSQVTVDAIIEAAARLFVRDGYKATTTNKIAELAGVSIGSLYEYFPNKASILAGMVRLQATTTLDMMRERVKGLEDASLEALVRVFARTGIEAYYKNLDLNRVLLAGAPRVAQWRQIEHASFQMADILREALKPHIRGTVRLEHAAFTVETVLESMLQRAVLFGHRLPGFPLEDEMAAVLLGYLRPLESGK
jgi:AcrR family transcriptional regulator